MVKKNKNGRSSIYLKIWRILKKIILVFLILSILIPLIYRIVPPPFTPLMFIRVFEQIINGEEIKLKKDWVSIDNISQNVILAAVSSEDQNFLKHHGFDFEAIEKAYEHNQKNKKTWGASTISQQTAKNVFLWPGRTWIRKGLEAYFTVIIEFLWPKKRIMEVYLNEIEMGDGIYGIEKASNIYLNKHSGKLSKADAALIVAAFPNPRKWNPGKPSSFLLQRQQIIMKYMGWIQKVEL
jgi:monofunctional glycosyltransferase